MRKLRINQALLAAALLPCALAGAYTDPQDTDGDGLLDTVETDLGTGVSQPDDIRDPAVVDAVLKLAFEWQLARPSQYTTGGDGNRSWVAAAFYSGAMWLYDATRDPDISTAMIQVGQTESWKLGNRLREGDDHCIGQTYLQLYMNAPGASPVWAVPTKTTLDTVLAQPVPYNLRDPSAGHGGYATTDWYSWADSLFMSPPTFAMMSRVTGNAAYLEYALDEWQFTMDTDGGYNNRWDHLYDASHGLVWRDDSYIDDTEPNGEPVFWSRGNGWVAAGLCEMIEFTPADNPRRAYLTNQLQQMAAGIMAAQVHSDDVRDGLWTTSLLYPQGWDEPELSGSAFLEFLLAYGVNHGLLDADNYGPAIEAGWAGMVRSLADGGKIRWIQPVGTGPGPNTTTNTSRANELHFGCGAFLFAGTEVAQYFYDRYFSFARQLPDATDTGDGWYHSAWYGNFALLSNDRSHWIYSADHGWTYVALQQGNQFWAYDWTLDDWFWVDGDAYPWMWSARHGWVYYGGTSGGPTGRLFWVPADGAWTDLAPATAG